MEKISILFKGERIESSLNCSEHMDLIEGKITENNSYVEADAPKLSLRLCPYETRYCKISRDPGNSGTSRSLLRVLGNLVHKFAPLPWSGVLLGKYAED